MTATAPVDAATVEPIEWEDLGAGPAGRAFRRSLCTLLRRPGDFFARMALSGGLHEPIAFLLILFGAAVVAAFAAALGYFVLHGAPALAPRATGVALALLPEVLVGGAVAMVMLGTVFHCAARLFGARGWEASVGIWLYSASAALVPVLVVLVVVAIVSALGLAAGPVAPGARRAALAVTAAACRVGLPLALGLAPLLMALFYAVGCACALQLDATLATAAAAAGLLAVLALLGLLAAGFFGPGAGSSLVMLGRFAAPAVLAALTVTNMRRERRSAGGAAS